MKTVGLDLKESVRDLPAWSLGMADEIARQDERMTMARNFMMLGL